MRTSQYLRPDSTHSTHTDAGAIDVHVFEPKILGGEESTSVRGTIVTVHPWAALGGGEHNTIGIARHITNASRNSETEGVGGGWRVITFPLKSSTAIWGICSAHSYEVQQTVDVVHWVAEKYGTDNIVLFGSSAGAPIAGTAMARLMKNGCMISSYIALGYTFGTLATFGFGRHFSSVIGKSADAGTQPRKLFIMGERDEFTSVDQLNKMVKMMKDNGHVETEIVAGVGHFELERSTYDPFVAETVLKWLNKFSATS